ncbi:MAG TPA: carboxymuconolactone decarboxylase family protein [Oligoflexus sp.]|uniref:carboxymuconolactone decarboxylase family protein n=1 Tax=Oligoflexus sp. TaxID=1971216 RepID=UPI002D7ED10C|nr:carboxymuconolactone decarboxylase family protein [Oligoflexus sp.]HET9236536.1 carboxymuconolactone decarboxylase family protein [Oligoflexus sp.]
MQSRLDFFKSAPEAIKTLIDIEQHIARAGLEKSMIELVRLRVSQINGCAYCIDQHARDARKAGEDERRLMALSAWRDTPFFNERERAALEWAESVTLIADDHAPDSLWERVELHFTASEIVELTLAITTINTWNRFAIAFRKLPA